MLLSDEILEDRYDVNLRNLQSLADTSTFGYTLSNFGHTLYTMHLNNFQHVSISSVISLACDCITYLYLCYTRHDPRSKHNQRKSKCQRQRSWGGEGVCSEPKEHLEWLETYLNAAGIITVQGYKHTKN